MKNNLSYNEAFAQLEKLVLQIEDDSLQLDRLAEKIKAANELIALCENKLRKIESDVDLARKI